MDKIKCGNIEEVENFEELKYEFIELYHTEEYNFVDGYSCALLDYKIIDNEQFMALQEIIREFKLID